MNVLLSAYACMPNSGSEPGNGWNWAMHLAERGITVTVLTRGEGRGEIEAYRRDHPKPKCELRIRNSTDEVIQAWEWSPLRLVADVCRRSGKDSWPAANGSTVGTSRDLHEHPCTDTVVAVGIAHSVWGRLAGGQTAPSEMLEYFGPSRASEERRTLLDESTSLLSVSQDTGLGR